MDKKLICRVHLKKDVSIRGAVFNTIDGVLSYDNGEFTTVDAIKKLNALIKSNSFNHEINVDLREVNALNIENFIINCLQITRIEVLRFEKS
jgi:hypothetical protein